MQVAAAAGGAGAALAYLERQLLQRGVAAASVLVWCSSASEARRMQAAADVALPLGTYDLTVGTELAVAQAVLAAADSPLASRSHFPVPPATASGLVRRVLASSAPSTLRPPNNPFKYQGDVERVLFALRYHGVAAEAWAAYIAAQPPARARALADLAALHRGVLAEIAATHTYDYADVVAAAVRVAADPAAAAAVRDMWPHVLLPDVHALTRPAVTLAARVYRSPHAAPHGAAFNVQAYGDASMQAARHFAPVAALAAATRDAPGWSWHAVDEVGSASLVSRCANALVACHDNGAAPAAHLHGVRLETTTGWRLPGPPPCEMAYLQGVAGERGEFVAAAALAAGSGSDTQRTADFIAALAAAATASPPTTTATTTGTTTHALQHAVVPALAQARTVAVVAKSGAAAAALTTALGAALAVDGAGVPCHAPGARPLQLVSDYAMRLADIPAVRTLLAVATVVAAPGDAQAVFQLATSPPYRVSHVELQGLLRRHRAAGSDEPLWRWLQSCAYARSGGAPRDPRRRARAASAAGAWDPSPLAPLADADAPPPLMAGAAPAEPLPPALVRAVADVAAAEDAYAASQSVAAMLVAFLRRSGLQATLARPADLPHATAADAVAALLRLVSAVESNAGVGAGAAGSEGGSSRRPPAGLPFVLDYLVKAVHTEGAYFHSGDRDDAAAVPTAAVDVDGGSDGVLPPPAVAAVDAPHDDGLLVVVTTAARVLHQRYDAVILVGATDSAYPGTAVTPAVDVPWGLLPAGDGGDGDGGCAAAPPAAATTATAARRAHRDAFVDSQRRRLRAVMARANRCVLFVAPSARGHVGSARHSGRRSRFLDELFGLPPTPVDGGAGVASHVAPPPPPPPPPTPTSQPLLPLSFTRMSEYLWCPHRHHLSRTVGLRVPPSAVLLYGRALHGAVAAAGDAVVAAVDVGLAALPPAAGDGAGARLPPPWHRLARVAALLQGRVGGGACADAAAAWVTFAAATTAALPSEAALTAAMLAAYADTWRHGRTHATVAAALADARDDADASLHADALAAIPKRQAEELYADARAAALRVARHELAAVTAALAARTPLPPGSSVSLPVFIEHAFRLPLPSVGVELSGVIDRVDVVAEATTTPGAAGGCAVAPVIREFKSGLQWRADAALTQRARSDNLQAALYATALASLMAEVAPALVPALAPARATFESIETGDAVALTAGAAGDAAAVMAAIASTAAAIRADHATPTPSRVKCGFCRFARVCHHAHGVHAPPSPAAPLA